MLLGLLLWSLWTVPSFQPSVQLPDGVSLAQILRSGKNETPKGWHTNQNYYGDQPPPKMTVKWTAGERMWLLFQRIRYGAHEMLGRSLVRAPNSPVVDYVTPRLNECFDTSGEKYLYARELGWEGRREDETRFLGFVWGGTNRLRHARDRIPLIENGIRQNGIFGMRLTLGTARGAMFEYLPTNQCAVIRDTKGLVKIVPLDYLKAYVDAGLVRLPMEK